MRPTRVTFYVERRRHAERVMAQVPCVGDYVFIDRNYRVTARWWDLMRAEVQPTLNCYLELWHGPLIK